MPTTAQLRSRLVAKLKELFQMDQPDLDFGFYRIMHAKSKQVTEFLEKDLLKVIEDTFGKQVDQQSTATLANARRDLEEALGADAVDENGLLKESFATLPAGKRYLEALTKAAAAKDALSAEGEIYDHLYRFFERYYEDGDFISRRYFSRETAGRAAPFAIPYNGEEVKLHWANADQYYIKTGEHFANFTVDLTKAPEATAEETELGLEHREEPLIVHFRVVEAAEGEHGNIKASDATKRFFLLHEADPICLNFKGELELRFEYRPDPSKPEKSQEGQWQEQCRTEAVSRILVALSLLPEAGTYNRMLAAKAPTEANRDRTLLAKYLHLYTARNTTDYFIHKDLGSFLLRELDFYIKNEVMRLDDIEDEDAPRVENYLAKIKVLRTIARQLITFLAQLENFQKKLWLKKKFVTETNYGITLDRIPEALYPDIIANEPQRQEWVHIYAINEIQEQSAGDLLQPAIPGYSTPLTLEFLKSQQHLVLDTRHFSTDFKTQLVASIQNFDEQCDGLLVHSENFQALCVLAQRYHRILDCIYIDPPYNTDASAILYKNAYKNSSWASLIETRMKEAQRLMAGHSILCFAIDDEESSESRQILSQIFANELGVAVVRSNPQSRKAVGKFSPSHEYALFYGGPDASPGSLEMTDQRLSRYPLTDAKGRYAWMNFIRTGNADRREDRPKMHFPIFVRDGNELRIPQIEWSSELGSYIVHEQPMDNEIIVYPISESGGQRIEKRWHRGFEKVKSDPTEYRVRVDSSGKTNIDFKTRLDEDASPTTWWDKNEYASANYGAAELKELFGTKPFDFPKARALVSDCLRASGFTNSGAIVLDFFGGSGTTGDAVIQSNRNDGTRRKYILTEMGDHFDTVLKPRIAKVIYSPEWKDGKPTSRDKGVSHCFKYVRLESYEDTLNNLRFVENSERGHALAANESLRRDYTLNYLLDVETRGSQSLLNIDALTDPTAYTLKVKKPAATGSVDQAVDLIETFNFLIGLRVVHLAAPQRFSAKFKRVPDPELPKGTDTRLQLEGKMKQSDDGAWWFRKVEGWVPKDRETPNNGQKEKILIVWRTLTGNLEEDNLMLDEWFQKNRLSTRDFEFDTIYVNGSNNLPNLKLDTDIWKVRLLEEEFHKAMWDVQDV